MNFTIGIPQAIWIMLFLFKGVYEIVNHGRPREGDHDAFMFVLLSPISIYILYWGGFFAQ